MEVITVELAFEIRKKLKEQLLSGQPRGEINVINNILGGYYDRVDDALTVAYEDVEFSKSYSQVY